MKWYLAKMVYRIVCGDGAHLAQFDEQLRLIYANSEHEAFIKGLSIGKKEEETFYNQKQQLVTWRFINVSEIHSLSPLTDGAEVYSRINEVDDANAYCSFVHTKANELRKSKTERLINLT